MRMLRGLGTDPPQLDSLVFLSIRWISVWEECCIDLAQGTGRFPFLSFLWFPVGPIVPWF